MIKYKATTETTLLPLEGATSSPPEVAPALCI